jgi:Family of unknown function (DUF5996)
MDTHPTPMTSTLEVWPPLLLAAWQDTYDTLHMWIQIIGKVRTELTPLTNHWWNSTLYVTARGLTTSPIPYGVRTFEMRFDFIDHTLVIESSDGGVELLPLVPRSVADFYHAILAALRTLGIDVTISTMPQEVAHPIPFDQDTVHASYDAEQAHRFWCILVQVDRLFKLFRARFIGKASPVHFFWGSFDLAVTRFSGRRAPERPGADLVTREAYSHEEISAGFWPGTGEQEAAFYAYAAPEPAGFKEAVIRPSAASYDATLGEFLLNYADVRIADDPDAMVLDFLQSTYEAAADRAGWDRAALER